jgi:YegS/Rv2252/BmrU family lipid kinase
VQDVKIFSFSLYSKENSNKGGKMFFIINRHAQGGQGYRIFIKKILPVIKEEISNFGFQVTSSKKETITIARRLVEQKEKTIIACGGDGTVNALTQPLRHTETFLGILPLGSANDFALASLGMPANPIKALYALLDGEEMNIDVGTIKNFSFLNVLGVGIDASITHLAHKHPIFHRMPLKELRYGFPLIQELQNPSFLKVRIIADSQLVFEGNVFYLSIYNGKREGAYFCLNNRGNINDGLLNVVIIENVNFQQRLRYLIETIKGDFKNLPAVHQFEGKEIEVTIFNGNEQIINAQIDGEPIIFESEGSSTVLTIKNDPKALRIIIPKA